MTSQPSWWRMKEDRTKSTSVRTATNLMLAERNESEVTHARWKALIGKEVSSKIVGLVGGERICRQDVGTFRSQKGAGKRLDGRGSNSGAVGEKLAKGSPAQRGLELPRESGIRLDSTMT